MTKLVKWPKIYNFHTVHNTVKKYPHLLQDRPNVTYRGKIKLHGTNSGIQILKGRVVAQSRTCTLEGRDNAKFAAWVSKHEEKFITSVPEGYTLFGEWCGPGVNKGCAIHNINNRIFAIFAAINQTHEINMSEDLNNLNLIAEPKELSSLIKDLNIPEVYVLPWHTEEIVINWLASNDEFEPIVTEINKLVNKIEICDPWVKSVFNTEGTGEGLVYYPISHEGRENFKNLAFKAKGEKHKIVKQKDPVVINPVVAASINEFVDLVVTDMRLEQGLQEACQGNLDIRCLGSFIGWICKDVKKECQSELEAANLTWKQVNKSVVNKAREWFKSLLIK